MQPQILLKNVSTTYEGEKKPAIKEISLSVNKGEFICIVGPNGAGKTTLLETICGCLKPVAGEIRVLGYDMVKNGVKARRKIGYVPQDFMVQPEEPYKALDVVLMGRYGKIGLIRRVGGEDLDKALAAMRMLEIEEFKDKPVGKLSGGQQQKVMIARALAKEPEILLLDEPLSNLDYDARIKVSEVIGRLNRESAITTLVVAHNPEHLIQQCDRVIVITNGRIIADIKCEDLEIEDFILNIVPSLRVKLK
jgi:zinc/manganese transport system ATP-binding protein